MDQFQIILRNDKTRFYDRFAVMIFLLNSVALILIGLYLPNKLYVNDKVIPIYIAFAVILFVLPSVTIIRKNNQRYLHVMLFTTVAVLVYWIRLGYWWAGLILILLVYLHFLSKKELTVTVSAERVIYPSFPVKNIQWQDLGNLILKDRLLTLDFKNNKLIQQDIDSKSYDVNEKDFNDFCRQQLKK